VSTICKYCIFFLIWLYRCCLSISQYVPSIKFFVCLKYCYWCLFLNFSKNIFPLDLFELCRVYAIYNLDHNNCSQVYLHFAIMCHVNFHRIRYFKSKALLVKRLLLSIIYAFMAPTRMCTDRLTIPANGHFDQLCLKFEVLQFTNNNWTSPMPTIGKFGQIWILNMALI